MVTPSFEKTVDLFVEVLLAQLAVAAKNPTGDGMRAALRKTLLAAYEAGRRSVIGDDLEPDAVVEKSSKAARPHRIDCDLDEDCDCQAGKE